MGTHGIVNVQLAELPVMLGETAGCHLQGYMIRRNEGFLAWPKNGRRVLAAIGAVVNLASGQEKG